VLAARGVLGWLEPSSNDDSPVTRRYALGGPSSHRGFGFGRLAPQAPVQQKNGTIVYVPVPGDGELLLSGETRLDLFRLWDRWVELVAFLDAGDVTARVSQLDPTRLHVAVGGSLEYQSPLGHVRAGAGVRINRTDAMEPDGTRNPDPDSPWAFHISIGEAF
jgi:outer membrane translocation and assembly module TamA